MLEQHDGGRVEVERIPELPHEQSQTVEIANVQVGWLAISKTRSLLLFSFTFADSFPGWLVGNFKDKIFA